MNLKQKSMFRSYSSFIQNISVFTKDFKNHKTYFKPLISGKIIFWTIQISFKTFRDVCLGFCLVCWFTSLRDFFVWGNVYVINIVSITHTVIFQNKKFQEGGQRVVAQARVNVHKTMGRKNNSKLNVFSMYFVWNNEEIYFYFKNSEQSFRPSTCNCTKKWTSQLVFFKLSTPTPRLPDTFRLIAI